MVFAIRGDIADPLMRAFHITAEQQGLVFSPAFWAFTIAIFIGGALVAVSQDITRGVLGVPGMNYSTLLDRSVDFARYEAVRRPPVGRL